MCPDGELSISRNQKNLFKDLATVSPWDSEPVPLIDEPALHPPRGVECCKLVAAPSQTRVASVFTQAWFLGYKGHTVPAITLSNARRCL